MSGHDEKKDIAIKIPSAFMLFMPSHKTYGKRRKKSILPFFQVYGDEKEVSPQLKEKTKRRTSATISISAFHGRANDFSNNDAQSCLDDSIEEMASMLLDDTNINELQGETGKRLSQTGSAKILPQLSKDMPSRDEALPQPSQVLFNVDGFFAMASREPPVARDVVYEGHLTSSGEEEPDSYPPPVSRGLIHARTSSVPTIPRGSSRRTPRNLEHFEVRDCGENSRQQPEVRKLTKIMQPTVGSPLQLKRGEAIPPSAVQPAVNRQIDNMLRASRALKPLGSSLLSDSSVAAEKIQKRRSGMLSKIKNAINERLYESHLRKHSQSPNIEQLQGSIFGNWSDHEDETSAVSAMELRLNEGSNLNNPKIQSLMGHGTIRRKPIADDGKSLKSRNSGDIITPSDQFGSIASETFLSSQYGEDSLSSIDQAKKLIQPPTNRSPVTEESKDEIFRATSVRSTEPNYDVDFDTLFSFSPLAQSTPRLRLESSFENDGTQKVQNISTCSHLVFDLNGPKNMHFPEMHVTAERSRSKISLRGEKIARQIHFKVEEPTVRTHLSKRRKKHPSPSKNELEDLEYALKHYSPPAGPIDPNTEDKLELSFGELGTEGILQSRDNNMLLRVPAKRYIKDSISSTKDKLGRNMLNSSTVEPARRLPRKFQKTSLTPKLAGVATLGRRPERLIFQLSSRQDESFLAMDELQWDSTTHNIGMNRT